MGWQQPKFTELGLQLSQHTGQLFCYFAISTCRCPLVLDPDASGLGQSHPQNNTKYVSVQTIGQNGHGRPNDPKINE